jgi:multiple sugar transport system permease protein
MKSRLYIVKWVLPAAILLVVIGLIPFFTAATYSFRAYSFTDSRAKGQFIGLDNYRQLVFDADFFNGFKVTFKYMIPALVAQAVLGLGIALLMSNAARRMRLIIPTMLLPTLLTPVVIGLIGLLTLNPDFGVLGRALYGSGLIKEAVLGSSTWALPAITVVDVWQRTPFVAVILLAGLLSLPKEPYEAAQVDGANAVQTFFRVTLPLLWPYLTVAMLIRVIDAFGIFDLIWVMTRGGPGTITESISVYAYRNTFRYWNLGYGSAIVMVIYVIMEMLVEFLYSALTRRMPGKEA